MTCEATSGSLACDGGDGARSAAGCVPAGEMEDCLARVLTQAAQQAFPGFFGTGAASAAPLLSIKWAAPPARAAHAAINVAAVSVYNTTVAKLTYRFKFRESYNSESSFSNSELNSDDSEASDRSSVVTKPSHSQLFNQV